MPALRTLGSALLSVIVVGMGASLGREGAPKQAGAVITNLLSDKAHLSDEQRRLLVACGAGAGLAAEYGVALGGTLFALEVLRGMFALGLVLPALLPPWWRPSSPGVYFRTWLPVTFRSFHTSMLLLLLRSSSVPSPAKWLWPNRTTFDLRRNSSSHGS